MPLKEMYRDFMKEPTFNSETVSRASVRTHKAINRIGGVILTLSLINALASPVVACGVNQSFDVTAVSDITAEQICEYAPSWCNDDMCNLIVNLSRTYGVSSEFALSVFRYEFVPERNSVGGLKGSNGYYNYTSIEQSIRKWFEWFAGSYCNKDSWHYSQTQGTTIHDIAPLYNQGTMTYNDLSQRWCSTMEYEVERILKCVDNHK